MFEIGRYYSVSFGTHDNYESTYGKCLDWAHPLLKFQVPDKAEVIINTANSSFLEAQLALAPDERRISGNMGSYADLIKDD